MSAEITIEQAIAAAVAAERERCAQLCDDLHHRWRWNDDADSDSGPRDCAKAIRGEKENDDE